MAPLRSALASLFTLGVLFAAFSASATAAERGPAWDLTVTSQPTNFVSGKAPESGFPLYDVVATNVGGAPTTAPFTITDTLGPGIKVLPSGASAGCQMTSSFISCDGAALAPGESALLEVRVEVEAGIPDGALRENIAEVAGGGAPPKRVSTTTIISSTPSPFGFIDGPSGNGALINDAAGGPSNAAGSHPFQLTLDLAFPSRQLPGEGGSGGVAANGGGVRDLTNELPRGLIVNPAAGPELCTEAKLQLDACPDDSAIGAITILTSGAGTPQPSQSPLFNMVPPPGMPAVFGFDAAAIQAFVHIKGELRSDGGFNLSSTTNDALARSVTPVLAVQAQLWADPSDPAHDHSRGDCVFQERTDEHHSYRPTCPVPAQSHPIAFLASPVSCPGTPIAIGATADSWEAPGQFVSASDAITDPAGNPTQIDGCNALSFDPTLTAQPTTNLTDSPSGLDVDLHQPQNSSLLGLATGQLKDATVTLPAGMSVNPSQASGLAACTPAQVGLLTAVGETPSHLSKQPNNCPDASKLGSVEVTTPLLAQYSEDGTKAELDPETKEPIPRPLHGALYLAQPYQNPFKSLIAIYLVIEDPQSGTVAKLAGRVIADPTTGQITTRFEENPQLPLEDVRLHLFGGARGALITPPTCGPHATTSTLTPWSSPEGQDAHPQDTFNSTAAPGGGGCPSAESAAANAPAFSAGTISPQAGAYSPFVLKLSREDGTQRFSKIETTLPPGLAARFVGVGECSEAQIAAAQARSHPEEGALEKANPSCPASSRLGTATVGAGAGPTPYYTQGTAYLAGPYKSAPFSLAIITPAIAGPFDLGTVVVRTALYVNPDTAQGRAVSDPLPTIIQGIPLDIRSVAISLDRSGFTLNPTSCEKLAVTGSLTSTLGALSPLSSPFQVGGCSGLPFKPKLSLTFKGKTKRTSHPRLLANLKAKPGEANIAKAQVKLPKAAFLDNAHIGTICTRVQFAADTCPSGSIYGKASAKTPLLDAPLSGAVYLRSSTHQLPDLVAKLKGPDSQPIEIDLAGRTDSVKGALRNTFEAVPDAPVSSFHLELFGGKRGLVILSSGFCKSPRATVQLEGQNGKGFDTRPVVNSGCPQNHKRQNRKHR